METPMPSTKKDTGTRSIERDLSATTIFDLLANDRRRAALNCLRRTVGAVNIRHLADQIALQEGDHTYERYERICTGLVHADVPKLEAAGVLEHDPERETVELLDVADQLVPYLDLVASTGSA